jgi:hypothetical protein
MTRQVQRLDRYGRPLPDDDDIIPDGGHIRVALPFMDHPSVEMRRALSLTMDGSNGGTDLQGFISGHRPGFAVAAVKDEAARDKYIRNVGDAWKNPPPEQPTQPLISSSPTSSTQDAKQSYRAYVDRISNAWRSP